MIDLEQPRGPGRPKGSTHGNRQTERWEPKKISWWHEQVADWMLSHPDKKLKDCAEFFKVTPTFIYMLTNSDAWKEYWKGRRADHVSFLSQDIVEKSEHLAHQALDTLSDKIELMGTGLSVKDLRDAAQLALEASGYLGKNAAGSGPGGDTLVFNAPAQVIMEARERARQARLQETDREETKTLPAGGNGGEGRHNGQPASLPSPAAEPRGESSGAEVREEGPSTLFRELAGPVR